MVRDHGVRSNGGPAGGAIVQAYSRACVSSRKYVAPEGISSGTRPGLASGCSQPLKRYVRNRPRRDLGIMHWHLSDEAT
jgi:hypothetical protein